MDIYSVGALSMEMSAAKMQRQASSSVMKASMELPEMAMDTLFQGMEGAEAALTGLGRYVDISV